MRNYWKKDKTADKLKPFFSLSKNIIKLRSNLLYHIYFNMNIVQYSFKDVSTKTVALFRPQTQHLK